MLVRIVSSTVLVGMSQQCSQCVCVSLGVITFAQYRLVVGFG